MVGIFRSGGVKPAVQAQNVAPARQWPGILKYRPVRALVPNVVTATGAACGVSASYIALTGGNLESASLLLVGAAVSDAVDGGVARALDASTKIGMYFDDLADFTAYGLAPGTMLFALGERIGPEFAIGGLVAGAMFATGVAYRLIRFSLRDPEQDTLPPHVFLGLPSTAGGPLIAGAMGMMDRLTPGDLGNTALVFSASAVVAGVMVSETPYEKFSSWARNIISRSKVATTARALMLSAGIAMTWSTFGPGAAMLGLWGGYAALGRYSK